MNNWSKVAAGVVLGVAGTIYATSEEARKNLPKAARDLPVSVRRRYKNAVLAAREASSSRRQEILRDLERHDREHAGLTARPEQSPTTAPEAALDAVPEAAPNGGATTETPRATPES